MGLFANRERNIMSSRQRKQHDNSWPTRLPEGSMTTALRREVAFLSDGVTCRAWLYVPAEAATRPSPCIVMAHGLSGTRDASLEPYAKRFADAGFYVVLFDYRYLGDSDGEPRQLVSIPRQLEDWKSAIGFARTLQGVDADRIALWGCSLSGGHVIVAAARDKRIAAVSAQCPMLDGHASARRVRKQVGFGKIVRLAAASIYDSVRAAFGLSPYYVPLVAPRRRNCRHADGGRVRRTESHRAAGLAQPGRRAHFPAPAVLPADPLCARSDSARRCSSPARRTPSPPPTPPPRPPRSSAIGHS